MKKIYARVLPLLVLIINSLISYSQETYFTDIQEASIEGAQSQRATIPSKYRVVSLKTDRVQGFLWSLPAETAVLNSRNSTPVITLPMPDGSNARFHVWESSIQEPGLENKFPEIKTFAGQGIDDPYATVRIDYNPYSGFHAQVLSPISGRIYIDPYAKGNVKEYISYYQADNSRTGSFRCLSEDPINNFSGNPTNNAGPCRGTELRTYRLAISCTGEYAQAVGGGLAGPTHAAIVTTVNRVNGVYEVELSVRLVLIATNNLIEYLDGTTDPFSNVISTALLSQNQSNTDLVIGSANYDIGHIFTSDDNGLAQLSAVCGTSKARGATGAPNLVGDGFDIDYVAHEMGHQFGGPHTFNSSSCASAGGSYEPGGGTTIMAYAGICALAENIQPNSDAIFHTSSFDAISNFVSGAGAGCGVTSPTGNTLPVITSMGTNNVSIPINTPFTLSATATDANGDALTYNWEGFDAGPAGTWPSASTSTTRPLFRTRTSKASGSRTFPDIRVIAANFPGTSAPSAMDGLRGEVLPGVARAMKFRLTVRDNRAGGGGVVTGGDGCGTFGAIFQVNAVGTAPFALTYPNGGQSFPGLTQETVTWNVANTDQAPVSTANVKISLSLDGGLTYPTVLVASTPNDGSESVTLPNIASTTARIKVEAIGNIFFDISNSNFTITVATPGFAFNNTSPANITCGGTTTANVDLGTAAVLGFNTPINLTATSGVPAGTTVSFSTNPVAPGSNTTVSLSNTNSLSSGTYNVTITGVAGSVTRTTVLSFVVGSGAAPAISAQPASAAFCSGSNATFTVATTGSPATGYQWQLSTDAGATYVNIAGATSSTLTLANVSAGQANNLYRVVVSGQCGTVTSAAATLSINTPVSITSQPTAAIACLPAQSSASFTVAATGTGASYQWQVSNDGGATFTNISGATSATLSLTGLTVAQNATRYRAVVSGACTPSLTSSAVVLTVNTLASINTQPTSKAVCAGGGTSFAVAATGSGITYQWQESVNNGAFTNITNGTVYSGATTPTLTVASTTNAMNNNRYQVVITSSPCGSVTSSVATLTVNALPSATLSADPTTITPYQRTSISVTGNTGGSLTYQWFHDGRLLSSVTGSSVPVTVDSLGEYNVVVTDGNGCVSSSNKITISGAASDLVFLYPNPNNGRFQVRYYNSSGSGKYKIVIFDAKGSRVHNQEFTINSVYTRMDVDLRRVQSGVYHLEIRDAQNKRLANSSLLVTH